MTFDPAPIPFDPAPANCALINTVALRRVHVILGDLLASEAAKTCPLVQLTSLRTAHQLIHDAIHVDEDATQEFTPITDDLLQTMPPQWTKPVSPFQEGDRVELICQPDNSPSDPFPLKCGTLGTVSRHPITDQLGIVFDGRGLGVTTGFMSGGVYIPALFAVQRVEEPTRS